jgi:hypothetical protein
MTKQIGKKTRLPLLGLGTRAMACLAPGGVAVHTTD